MTMEINPSDRPELRIEKDIKKRPGFAYRKDVQNLVGQWFFLINKPTFLISDYSLSLAYLFYARKQLLPIGEKMHESNGNHRKRGGNSLLFIIKQ